MRPPSQTAQLLRCDILLSPSSATTSPTNPSKPVTLTSNNPNSKTAANTPSLFHLIGSTKAACVVFSALLYSTNAFPRTPPVGFPPPPPPPYPTPGGVLAAHAPPEPVASKPVPTRLPREARAHALKACRRCARSSPPGPLLVLPVMSGRRYSMKPRVPSWRGTRTKLETKWHGARDSGGMWIGVGVSEIRRS